MVMLNNHHSRAGWCCSEQDGEGLWWTASYPQEMWLQALAAMAENYATNPRVVGLDLRNELRRAHGHSPVWGGGGQPRQPGTWHWTGLLVIVEGLEYAGTVERRLQVRLSCIHSVGTQLFPSLFP